MGTTQLSRPIWSNTVRNCSPDLQSLFGESSFYQICTRDRSSGISGYTKMIQSRRFKNDWVLVREIGKMKFAFVRKSRSGFVGLRTSLAMWVWCNMSKKISKSVWVELAQKGWLWKSEIGIKHLTNPGNHETCVFTFSNPDVNLLRSSISIYVGKHISSITWIS